jgi:hypothetical protein
MKNKLIPLVAGFFLLFVANEGRTTIITNSSNEIIQVTGIVVSGNTYDVIFDDWQNINKNEQIALWSTNTKYLAAVNALVAELNTSNSYVVSASDGSPRNNQIFMVQEWTESGGYKGTELSRTGSGGNFLEDWHVQHTNYYSADRPSTSFTLVSSGTSSPVPEPTTMLLFGTGIAGLIGNRVRRKK